MHGQSTSRPAWADAKSERIARLSEEFLKADDARRDEIGEEITGLIAGRVLPLARS